MASFTYWAYDALGQRVKGQIEAESEEQATHILAGKGLMPYRTVPLSEKKRLWTLEWSSSKSSGLRLGEYASFVRQLATLLEADLPLDQSVRLVASQSGGSRVGTFSTGVAEIIASGRSLSAALDQLAPTAPKFMVALVRAGEARGALAPCLVELAAILERGIEVRSRLRGAFVYPAILLVVALAAVGIVVGILVPTLLPMFKDSGIQPPVALRVAAGIGELVATQWHVLAICSLLLIALMRQVARMPAVRARASKVMLALPVIGSLTRSINIAMIARTLGTLLRNGVSLVNALPIAASVAVNGEFNRALGRAAKAVNEGGKLSQSLRTSSLFPDRAIRFMAIGEEASKLSEMLLNLANIEDIQSRNRMDTLLTVLTPVITIVVGMMVGGLILSVMQAVLSVNNIAL